MSGGCGNVVNPVGFSIISMAGARGEGGGDFLFGPGGAAFWLLPLPPAGGPRRSGFSLLLFLFGGERMAMDQQTAMEQLRELYREKNTSIWRGSWSLSHPLSLSGDLPGGQF